MARSPVVLDIIPRNNSIDVVITDSIHATFDIDLDARYITDFVFLLDEDGNKVEGRITYRKKAITFMPLEPLHKGHTYLFCLIGDKNLEDNIAEGIRSIVNIPLKGRYTINFTTELGDALPSPTIVSPMNGTIVREQPMFSWQPVTNAIGYEIQVSKTNTFSTLLFPINDEETIIEDTAVEVDVPLNDGIYYWRICSIRKRGEKGMWGLPSQFHLTRVVEGTIAPDDSPNTDVVDEFLMDDLEIVDTFPKDGSIQQKLNVSSIFFRLIGDIDPLELDLESIILSGMHVTEDEEEESHMLVNGQYSIVRANDGTTYLVFTPDQLPDPPELDEDGNPIEPEEPQVEPDEPQVEPDEPEVEPQEPSDEVDGES